MTSFGTGRLRAWMRGSVRVRAGLAGALIAPILAVLVLPTPASGQDLPPTFGRVDPDPDFLFGPPRVSIGLRGGVFFHRAQSDLFDFAQERLTVEPSDFKGPAFGLEAGVWLGQRWEVNIALDGSQVSIDSEYRDLVEDDGSVDGLPIRQTTRLTEGPAFSLGGRYYLFDRGEQLGQFVWLPRRWNAFLGAGAGVMNHDLELSGDFVNEDDLTISTERFESSGSTLFPYISGGLELTLSDRTAIALEGRYLWADQELDRDFQDFADPLDLSGFRVTAGIYLRN